MPFISSKCIGNTDTQNGNNYFLKGDFKRESFIIEASDSLLDSAVFKCVLRPFILYTHVHTP